ncbi:hypothetical protein D920_00156 [Enterococcus faecalis 13-SD-W-01]|nr:hypothetical protein D920_00156 [Enterococcus faecalis 13-SD-W-01]
MLQLSEFLFLVPFFSIILYIVFFNKWKRKDSILFISFLPTIYFVTRIVHHPLEDPISLFNFYLISLLISTTLNIFSLFIIDRMR